MKYREFVEELRKDPKKHRDLVKLEYEQLKRERLVYTSLTIALVNVGLVVAKLLGLIYGVTTLIVTAVFYIIVRHDIEMDISELRDLLIKGNCVTPMAWRELLTCRDFLFTLGFILLYFILITLMYLGY